LFLIGAQCVLAGGGLVYGQASDYQIDDNKTSASIPFEFIDNRIFVAVKINAEGPFHFILDSGGANLVTPEIASRLRLKLGEAFKTGGVGEQSVGAWLTTVERVQIGREVQATNQKFTVLSLEPITQAIGFKKLDGLVGFQLFSSFVTRIDYERHRITFIQPSKFHYQGSGTIVPFDFAGRIPQIDANVDGLCGKIKIDTGDRSSLTLYVPFIETNHLREKYAPPFKTITGWGIGGPVPAQITRAKTISFAGVILQNIIARLPVLKSGSYMDSAVMGSVGAAFLKRFNIVFDYSRKVLIFEKNRNFAAPDVYDRAGMWLKQSGDVFEVADVVPDSPSEKGGIKIGDQVLAVNGRPSSELVLPKVRMLLNSAGHIHSIKLTIKSGGTIRNVLIALEDLI
jgi:hypothetical protein